MNGHVAVNGWRNRATWLVNLWFNPETVSDICYLEETLQHDFEKMIEEKFGTSAHFYTDLIDFTDIDWQGLKEAMEEEE